MANKTAAIIFRRHQCPGLGWEWCASNFLRSESDARESARRYVDGKVERSLLPVPRNSFRTYVVPDTGDDVSRDLIEKRLLRDLNRPYAAERAKWPWITQDCSDELIAALEAESTSPTLPPAEVRTKDEQ